MSGFSPPRAELATVVRASAGAYRDRYGLSGREDRVLRAIAACRTEAMGGHVAACNTCGREHYCYHSCRNRHCPKCQTHAKEQWLERQRAQLLPVPYFHVVFTLPHALNDLVRFNPQCLYALLFESAAQTLQDFAGNPRWLGGELGFTLVLHTWSQTLVHHPHVHGLVSGGAVQPNGQWRAAKPGFLFPVQALSRVFRGKYLDALEALHTQHRLRLPEQLNTPAAWRTLIGTLRHNPWVVYLKPPLSGPEQVLEYLARYTHRVAISNERLIRVDAGSAFSLSPRPRQRNSAEESHALEPRAVHAALSYPCAAGRLQTHPSLRTHGQSMQSTQTRLLSRPAAGANTGGSNLRAVRHFLRSCYWPRPLTLPALPKWTATDRASLAQTYPPPRPAHHRTARVKVRCTLHPTTHRPSPAPAFLPCVRVLPFEPTSALCHALANSKCRERGTTCMAIPNIVASEPALRPEPAAPIPIQSP